MFLPCAKLIPDRTNCTEYYGSRPAKKEDYRFYITLELRYDSPSRSNPGTGFGDRSEYD